MTLQRPKWMDDPKALAEAIDSLSEALGDAYIRPLPRRHEWNMHADRQKGRITPGNEGESINSMDPTPFEDDLS